VPSPPRSWSVGFVPYPTDHDHKVSAVEKSSKAIAKGQKLAITLQLLIRQRSPCCKTSDYHPETLAMMYVTESDTVVAVIGFGGEALELALPNLLRGLSGVPKGIADSLDSSSGASNADLGNVNPGFSPDLPSHHPRKLNCINCAIATDASLAGHPASAFSSPEGELILVLEDWFNQSFRSASPESIVSELQGAGPGSRGIVYGERPKPELGIDGHVFNAYNDDGVIRFVDGQNNSTPDLSTMNNFGFLRTN
jgi:hypothetical protein